MYRIVRTGTLWGAIALAGLAPQMASGQERDQPVRGSVAPIPPIAAPSPTATNQPERLPGIPAINFSLDGEKSGTAETAPPENAPDAAQRPQAAAQAEAAPRASEARTRSAPAPTREPAATETDTDQVPEAVGLPDTPTETAEAVPPEVAAQEAVSVSDQGDASGSSNSLLAFLFGAFLLAGAVGLMLWRGRRKPAPAETMEAPAPEEAEAPPAPPQIAEDQVPVDVAALSSSRESVRVPEPAVAQPSGPPERPVTTIASSIPAAPGAPVVGKTLETERREPAPAATQSGIPLPPRANPGRQQPAAGLPRFDMFGRPIAGPAQQPASSQPAGQKPAPGAAKPRKGIVRYDMMGRPILD